MLENIFARNAATKAADIVGKKVDGAAADKAAQTVLRQASIDVTDKAAFSAAAQAATELSPADLVAQLKAAKPTWTNDNRDAFKPYLDNLLNGIKNLRGTAATKKAAVQAANQDVATAEAKFMVPVNGAKSAVDAAQAQFVGPVNAASANVSAVDSKFRGIANQAQSRLDAAKTGMRSTLRPGADQAQASLEQAINSVGDLRASASQISSADVEGTLANMATANQTIADAANRIQMNGSNLAGSANALVANADAGVQQIGQTMQATGNGIAGDAMTTAQNASQFNYGLSKIRDVHSDVRNTAQALDGDLANMQQALSNADAALAANPNDEVVLQHARNLVDASTNAGSTAYTGARDALMGDYAGANPGAVFPALDQAEGSLRNVQGRLQSIDPGSALDQDLYTMDQTANVIGQTGGRMQQGAESIRPSLSGIQTTDASLQSVIDQMSSTGDAMSTDASTIATEAPLLNTSSVRGLHDDIRQARDSVATSAQSLDTYITGAKQALSATPADAQIQGSARELVTSYDANTKAWQDLSTNLADANGKLSAAQSTFDQQMTPSRTALANAQAQFESDMTPSRQVAAAAQQALQDVTVPLGQLEEFTKGLPDTVGTMTRLHWNNPVAIFDHGKVDVNKVYQGEVQSILGGSL